TTSSSGGVAAVWWATTRTFAGSDMGHLRARWTCRSDEYPTAARPRQPAAGGPAGGLLGHVREPLVARRRVDPQQLRNGGERVVPAPQRVDDRGQRRDGLGAVAAA